MEVQNSTFPSKFILLGFYEWPHLQVILFLIFFLVYLMALTGNLFMIGVISFSSNLHTPMYFFLGNLSFLDIILTSTIMPKLLDICLAKNNSITYLGCLIQMLFFVLCASAEYFLLAAMAYDRCIAICCPLRYSSLINLRFSYQLSLMSWGFGILESLALIALFSRCSFQKSNIINQLFCEVDSLLKISSSGTQEAQTVVSVMAFICGFFPLVFIIVTYFLVIYHILKIRSNEGKRKAFSTCSSHLTLITLFLSIILRLYLAPKSDYSVEREKILTVIYTCLIPTLNPVIYSLRNKDVHVAVLKLKVLLISQQ